MTQKENPSAPSDSEGKDGRKKLLLIDDQIDKMKTLFEHLKPCGYQTYIEASPDKAIMTIHDLRPDVVLLDLHFPGDDLDASGETTGTRLLGQIQHEYPELPIVIFSKKLSDDRLSLDSMGPQRYYDKEKMRQFTKKSDWAADLTLTLGQTIDDKKLKKKRPAELDEEMGFVVGTSPVMEKVMEAIRNAAGNAMTVLVEGETGTGKELVARAIHRLSGRKGFTAVNCSAVHLETLEARLFGHEKGAFTGADAMKMGLFELTTGGTVFLDEIQIMPASLQSKLIRVVQDNMIVRMGGKSEFPADVRLIVATNKPAKELVHEGLLREDLYYRLNTLFITLPPLRQRMEDIPLLWSALIEKANKAAGKTVMTTLRKEVRELLDRHAWPGNIRELEGVINRAVVNTKGSFIAHWDIVFESEPTCFEIEPVTTVRHEEGHAKLPSDIDESVLNHENSEDMNRLFQLPASQRWEYLIANTAGDSRKSVFVEIVRRLKTSRPHKRLTAKELTEFLCGEEGESIEDRKKYKNNYDKVRSRLSSLKLELRQLDFNQ